MPEYYILNDEGIPERHIGEVQDAPVDFKKMMLDYGWVPPVAYGAYKLAEPLVEKGRDYLKSRKLGKQKESPMAFGDEGIIDVSSRDVTVKEPVPKGWEEIVAKSEANAASKAAEAAAKANPIPTGMTPGIPTGQPNVSVNPAGAFTQPSGYGVAPPAPVLQPGQFDPSRIGQPLQDPLAGGGFQTPAQEIGPRPSLGQAVATGGNVAQETKQVIANLVDEVPKPVTPVAPTTSVKKTKGVKPPVETELRTGYEFRPGFGTSDTYLVDTIGPEKYKIARMELNEGKPFGKYDVNLVQDVMNKYRVGEKVTSEVAKAAGAGAMSSPGGVPSKSIQRGLQIGGILGMGLPAWLAARAAELPGYDEAMARAGQAVPGMGTSANAMPFSRGEEMSQMGRAYVTAGNQNYRAQLEQQLSIEKDPARVNQLIGELQKLGTVGAGRGIAPPSAYQR